MYIGANNDIEEKESSRGTKGSRTKSSSHPRPLLEVAQTRTLNMNIELGDELEVTLHKEIDLLMGLVVKIL
ncbi:hypothetical protein OS493_017667 [Desmophyllum pertusum]|uniref:Uncharacterized protein n=1 Tax=Desmophyllum pertusum TaxID=174260 RepID=A0A9X0CZH0_9CNID|nr:hypothetical protein OS493_017667 [Desmophyllum pertusum]